jgi:hypothetical protein
MLAGTADWAFLWLSVFLRSRFNSLLAAGEQKYLGILTLDQPVVVRIHVPEPKAHKP